MLLSRDEGTTLNLKTAILRSWSSLLSHFLPQPLLDRLETRRIDDFYETKIREAEAAKDAVAVEQLEAAWATDSWSLERGQRLRAQRRLFREAARLHVPRPRLTKENSFDGVLMNDDVLLDLMPKILKAQKARQELRLAWIPLATALTGLVGTIAAVVALLKR
jgi:hypothetical protein